MEHSPVTLESLRNMVLATRGLPAHAFARVPVNETLDREARARCRRERRDLPLHQHAGAGAAGRRGVPLSAARTARLGRESGEIRLAGRGSLPRLGGRERDRDHRLSRRRARWSSIDEIAATPGVDAMFIGTSDLSFSLGLRGDQKHPRLQEAIAKVLDAGKRHGKFVGRPAGESRSR